MILRSITKHVKEQNWIAIFIDFIIVVFGVFIGIQVANWNQEQAFYERETQLLNELKREIKMGIDATRSKGDSYAQVLAAGKRSLEVISNGGQCDTDCWLILVDFMHASQWQNVGVNHSIYDEMRRLSLPRNRAIIESVDRFLAQNVASSVFMSDKPVYRNKVRQSISFNVQEYYWLKCYTFVGGVETYLLNCPEGITNEMASLAVKAIVNDPDIKHHLKEWASNLVTMPSEFAGQNEEARNAIALIDAELERR